MAQARATGLFVSLCTIQSPDGTLGAGGAPSGTYTNASGLVNIACMDAPQPPSEIRVASEEFRAGTQVEAKTKRHVLLDNYYPSIKALWRAGARAVVDGIYHDICGVENDSQRTQTRMELVIVSAGVPE